MNWKELFEINLEKVKVKLILVCLFCWTNSKWNLIRVGPTANESWLGGMTVKGRKGEKVDRKEGEEEEWDSWGKECWELGLPFIYSFGDANGSSSRKKPPRACLRVSPWEINKPEISGTQLLKVKRQSLEQPALEPSNSLRYTRAYKCLALCQCSDKQETEHKTRSQTRICVTSILLGRRY